MKNNTHTFVVEIGCEELPPKALQRLARHFYQTFCDLLQQANLTFGESSFFASPRRLAIKVEQLATQQPQRSIEKRGPAVSAAFDETGQPSRAALGWAKSCGISLQQAQRLETPKGQWLFHQQVIEGQKSIDLLPKLVAQAISTLPITKPMRWGASQETFVRPVQSILLLCDDQLIDASLLGKSSSRTVLGHRFMGQQRIQITHAQDYPDVLEKQGCVIACFQKRKAYIAAEIARVAQRLDGCVDIDDALLEEVTALVEWPVVLHATFSDEFLKVPSEALVQTMKDDQKYFPIHNHAGQLLPCFIFVSNLASTNPKQIIAGNERVITPRLADAQFFFQTDRQHPLDSHLKTLERVVFQKQLGTLHDRSQRIASLAGFIATQISANSAQAQRAGLLSKCDLMTQMVGEFPEIQGIIGKYYALDSGEAQTVATAIEEQYRPRFSGDELPQTDVGCAVALAEKIDTLVGIFGIGQFPKGDKDPFALRRCAIGVNRILIERTLNLDLASLFRYAQSLYDTKLTNQDLNTQLCEFMFARLRAWYLEQGIAGDTLQAVLSQQNTQPFDVALRVMAVDEFRDLPAAQALAQANKRVQNILSKQQNAIDRTFDPARLQEDAEQALYQQLLRLQPTLEPLLESQQYTQALTELSNLRDAVDGFFEHVMVMTDDQTLRENRLALLTQLRSVFLGIADIAHLQSSLKK